MYWSDDGKDSLNDAICLFNSVKWDFVSHIGQGSLSFPPRLRYLITRPQMAITRTMNAATPIFSCGFDVCPSSDDIELETSPSRFSVVPGISIWKWDSLIGSWTLTFSSFANVGLSVPDELKRSIRKQAHIVLRRISRSVKLNSASLPDFRPSGSWSSSR